MIAVGKLGGLLVVIVLLAVGRMAAGQSTKGRSLSNTADAPRWSRLRTGRAVVAGSSVLAVLLTTAPLPIFASGAVLVAVFATAYAGRDAGVWMVGIASFANLLLPEIGGLGDLDRLVLIAVLAVAVTTMAARETRLRADAQRWRTVADIDPLTGAANRRAFDDRLNELTVQATRAGMPLWLIALDLDRLKQLNDTYGHDAGDDILRALVTVARNAVRQDDLVVRLGGDEFAIVLAGAGRDRVEAVAAGLQRDFAAATQASIPATVSIGFAEYVHDSAPVTLMAAADRALYDAKRGLPVATAVNDL